MNEIYDRFKKKNLKSKMILQVHDELVFEILKDELTIIRAIVRDCMCQAAAVLEVPVKVSLKIGRNWLEAEKI
jgi:DNA polymerase-1